MTEQRKHRDVEVSDGDRPVASADVTTSTDSHDSAHAALSAESGHIPPGSRARLVDAELDLPEVQDSARLEVTVPLGDAESLQRLTERTAGMPTHSAGSSALVDAELLPTSPPDPAEPEDILRPEQD